MMRQPSHNSSTSSNASPRARLNFFKKKPSLNGSVLSHDPTTVASDKIFDPPSHSDKILHSPSGASDLELSTAKSHFAGLPSPDSFVAASLDVDFLRLRDLIRKLRKTPLADYKKVDAVWEVYKKYREECLALCKTLAQKSCRSLRSRAASSHPELGLITPTGNLRRPSVDTSSGSHTDSRSSISQPSTGSSTAHTSSMNEQWLSALTDYKKIQDILLESLRTSLLSVYKSYEPKVTERQIEKFLNDRTLRKNLILKWRDESIHRMRSEKPMFWDEYRLRSSNYDRIKADVEATERLLTQDIEEAETLLEIAIARNGDTVLDFANTGVHKCPTIRYRVSSHLLAAASPLFAQFLTPQEPGSSPPPEMAKLLPPAPSRHVCKDGMEVKVFQMPQVERNEHNAFTLLLHAAHMHNERIPRQIPFPVFVSISEACLKYRCTSPLELTVEYQWLPQWIHLVGDEKCLDGFLVISYTFGQRQIFTRLSKAAILTSLDDDDIDRRSIWPPDVRERVKATRAAKIAQIYDCCAMGIQEYFSKSLAVSDRRSTDGTLQLTTSTRCPRNSHQCDATNLGWLLLVYNELQILPSIIKSVGLRDMPSPPKRSLKQLVDSLRLMPSAPQVHSGVCDYAAAFKSDINDIFNSVQGLALRDVKGKTGWNSRQSEDRSDDRSRYIAELEAPMERPKPSKRIAAMANEVIGFRILSYLDNMEDLSAAAMIDRSFYRAYKRNEASLLKNIMKAERQRTMSQVDLRARQPRSEKGVALSHLKSPVSRRGKEPKYLAADKDRFPSQSSPSLNDLYDASPPFSPTTPDDVTMSEEEAKKILWPDLDPDDSSDPSPTMRRGGGSAGERNEKSLAGSVSHIEDKARMVDGEKNLRDEKERALGLGKHTKKK